MPKFNLNLVIEELEKMRRPNGAFIASLSPDYYAMWLRDQLWCSYAYWYMGEYEKCRQGIHVVMDVFKEDKGRIIKRNTSPSDILGATIHAKRNADTLERITADDGWGHHQLDVFGLFFYIVSNLQFKQLDVIRDQSDLDIIQDLVVYMNVVKYWFNPDFGMWEECKIRHMSSIGAVWGGLNTLKMQRLALDWAKPVIVSDPLLEVGYKALYDIFPYESRDRSEKCNRDNHSHDCDAAQLFLIWPFRALANTKDEDMLISRIVEGHIAENGESHCLLQAQGITRYWNDMYRRSYSGIYNGISAMWPMFLFELSIIYSQRHDTEKARYWFEEGCKHIVDGKVPEAYQNGVPNDHTPLGWGNALAIIAFTKLPPDVQVELSSEYIETKEKVA